MVALPVVAPRSAAESVCGLLQLNGTEDFEGSHTFTHQDGFCGGENVRGRVVPCMQWEKWHVVSESLSFMRSL